MLKTELSKESIMQATLSMRPVFYNAVGLETHNRERITPEI
jgi:hypothetical protein